MILLAIDTARENCAVGLSIDGVVVVSEQAIGKGHAEVLMPQIAALLAEAKLKPRDIGRIAVSVGPGSFTGLRVGISAARGLALAIGAPVIGVPSLRAHAFSAIEMRNAMGLPARPVLALMPARGEEFYAQAFDAGGTPTEPPSVSNAAAIAERLGTEDFDFAGGLIEGDGLPRPLHQRTAPDIRAVIALGLQLDPTDNPPRPLYVRPPDALPQTRNLIARR